MPDISMCSNDKCKVRKQCYRYMTKPDHYQTYATFGRKDNKKCKDFIGFDFSSTWIDNEISELSNDD